jgi:LPXTG-site transpeptidase (sortase) family protein
MPQIAIPLPELNAPDVKIPEVKVKTPAIAFQNPFRFLSQIDIPFLKEKKKPATSDIFSINKPAFANETNLVALQNFDPGPKNPFPESEASILIPKIDISAPIILSQSPRNRDMLKDLEKGTALYPESPLFGEQGVSILLGHSSAYPWYRGNYGSVFALLNKLELGDEFYVFFKGNRYTYQVANKKVVVPEDFKVENPDHGSHLILMSCWPVGTNWKRIVVFSDLINFN